MQGDIRDVDLHPGRYDFAVAAAVLHHLRGEEEWRQVFRKVGRLDVVILFLLLARGQGREAREQQDEEGEEPRSAEHGGLQAREGARRGDYRRRRGGEQGAEEKRTGLRK